jgi:hypothetical protein
MVSQQPYRVFVKEQSSQQGTSKDAGPGRCASTKKKPQISPLRYALSKNISTKGRQHRDLSAALRFGRDDKGEGGASMESGLGQKAFFITLGGPQAHDNSGRDDKFVARKCSEYRMDEMP